jgi:hypothetical protein
MPCKPGVIRILWSTVATLFLLPIAVAEIDTSILRSLRASLGILSTRRQVMGCTQWAGHCLGTGIAWAVRTWKEGKIERKRKKQRKNVRMKVKERKSRIEFKRSTFLHNQK